MKNAGRILVVGATREAQGLARDLVTRQVPFVASSTPPDRGPHALHSLHDRYPLVAVIDASHPFDDVTQTYEMATEMGLHWLRLMRPPWVAEPDDQWQTAPDVAHAATLVPPTAIVFSNTGRASQMAYDGFTGQRLYLRQTERHDDPPPFDFIRYSFGTPPFSESDEVTLFNSLGITGLICRNVGGDASKSKLHAARQLSLPVILIDRPAPPAGAMAATVDDACRWLDTI